MANKTWDGSGEPVEQADPEAMENPRSSILARSAELSAPSTIRHRVLESRLASRETTWSPGIAQTRDSWSPSLGSGSRTPDFRERRMAACIAAAPATSTVPPRRERCWFPPWIHRDQGAPLRIRRAPDPLVDWNLWPDRETNAAGTSVRSTSILPKHWTESRWRGIFASANRRAKVPASDTAPVSLLAQIRLARAVGASKQALSTSWGSQVPSARKGSRTTSQPSASNRSSTPSVDACSPRLDTTRPLFPRAWRHPRMAVWMLSVPPEVRIHSLGRLRVHSAKAWQVPSTISPAPRPSRCRDEEFPQKRSEASRCASIASGQGGVVAFQSR